MLGYAVILNLIGAVLPAVLLLRHGRPLRKCRWLGHIVPSTASQEAPVGLLRSLLPVNTPATPLFEEKRSALCTRLALNAQYPVQFHWPCLGSGLSTDDHPIDA